MTVHELPMPSDVAQADERRTRSGRLKMLLMLLICAAPVIASYIAYYFWQPEARHHHGELITPPRDLPQQMARDVHGQALSLTSLKGQWLLLVAAPGECNEHCEKNLYLQRQLREALGKDKDRLDRVWLVEGDAPVRPALLPALEQATVLHVDPSVLHAWLQASRGHALQDHLYVIDPMGNWMMRFPANMDVHSASKAKRDLERLMRASASWDQPGR
jgi:hypothetical protein